METQDINGNFGEYKQNLNIYSQQKKLHIPYYTIENEGFPHAPQFRATVHVAGRSFESPLTFSRVQKAEHFVAKLAFESLTAESQLELDPSIIGQDLMRLMLCKSVLHEYGVKKGDFVLPVYETKTPDGGPTTIYFSSVQMNGNIYTGPICKSKKEAEQHAALVAITAILEGSESRGLMMEIIGSKYKSRPILNAIPIPNPNVNTSNLNLVSTDAKAPEINKQDGQDINASNPVEIKEFNGVNSATNHVAPIQLAKKPTFDVNLSKMILHEYGVKKGYLGQFKYHTSRPEGGPTTHFFSTVEIDGNIYGGLVSRSKKEAERNAAFFAINSLLENNESKSLMLEVIMSKMKFIPKLFKHLEPNPIRPSTNLNVSQIQPSTDLKADEIKPAQSSVDLKATEMNLIQLVGPGKSKNARKRAKKKQNENPEKKIKVN